MAACAKELVKKEGVLAFWSGFGPATIKVSSDAIYRLVDDP